jgi:nucleoside-diphosphate-sugar epimerase
MRVFITGATGFIGRHVLEEIRSSGHDILALTRRTDLPTTGNEDIQWIRGDLRDLAPLKPMIREYNPDAVVHLAWQGIPDYTETVSTFNLFHSIQLMDFILENTACKKIIVSGSCFEYGGTKGECKETDAAQPTSFFPWAKHSLYEYLRLKCPRNRVVLVWLRIF